MVRAGGPKGKPMGNLMAKPKPNHDSDHGKQPASPKITDELDRVPLDPEVDPYHCQTWASAAGKALTSGLCI